MERSKVPNKGLMSPPGGKLKIEDGESPVECAVREVYEECLLHTQPTDWTLMGIITEKNYPPIGDIMIFLLKYEKTLDELPPKCDEGTFHFIHPNEFKEHKLPATDNLFIWKNVLNNNGIFMTSLDCSNYPEIEQLN